MARKYDHKNRQKKTSSKGSSFNFSQFFSSYLGSLKILLALLLLLLGIFVLHSFYRFLQESPRYLVSPEISGNRVITDTEVLQALTVRSDDDSDSTAPWLLFLSDPDQDGDTPLSLHRISATAVKQRLREEFPRFEKIIVSEHPPRRLKIQLKERQPIAWRETDRQGFYFKLVDRQNVSFYPHPQELDRAKRNLPRVLGIEDDSSDWQRFLEVHDVFREMFNRRVEHNYQFKGSGGSIVVTLNSSDGPEVILGPEGDYREKIAELYRIMRSGEYTRYTEIDIFDLEDVRVR